MWLDMYITDKQLPFFIQKSFIGWCYSSIISLFVCLCIIYFQIGNCISIFSPFSPSISLSLFPSFCFSISFYFFHIFSLSRSISPSLLLLRFPFLFLCYSPSLILYLYFFPITKTLPFLPLNELIHLFIICFQVSGCVKVYKCTARRDGERDSYRLIGRCDVTARFSE